MDFKNFTTQTRKRFDTLAKDDLFIVDMERNELWDVYLCAFPEGTDPIYRVNTVHDCSCCRNFIRNAGNVVSIKDGKVSTIWEGKHAYPYDVVAAALDEHVRSKAIQSIFLSNMRRISQDHSRELIDGRAHTWEHFSADVPLAHYSRDMGPKKNRAETAAKVFKRGLTEFTAGAVDEVIELIDSKSLYRGEAYEKTVKDFRALQQKYAKLNSSTARSAFVWENYKSSAATLKNTVMGTLIEDLSNGVELERAVRSYETKTAPQNYRRTTALITPKMVEKAVEKLRDLDLEGAVKRRHARLSDISVNDVLYVDNEAQTKMKDGLTDLLMGETVTKNAKPKKATDIIADDFIENILPKATSMEVVLSGQHQSNFVSLTAPEEEDTGKLFAWDNDFAWAYDGDVADSIKERVKKAGGDVEAVMRVSLAWANGDDLDLHCMTPHGQHISFRNKAGILDVDMNAGSANNSTDPVENMRWKTMPRDGVYEFSVNNFAKRSSKNPGFQIEFEFNGESRTYTYAPAVRQGQTVGVLKVHVLKGRVTKVENATSLEKGITGGAEKWGVKIGDRVPVDSVMLSPNYWGENKSGHKHLFFILRGCKNDQPVRGLFNEFLRPELREHRKVFEVLGSKTKCEPTEEQLSGVGFSAAREDTATVIVNGGQAYNVHF